MTALLAAEPGGPLARLLQDPAGALGDAADAARALAEAGLPWLAGAAVTGAVALAGASALSRRRRRAMAAGARVVTLLAPPEVEPSGGEALWSNLHSLLRPRWRRLMAGQPHLSFEYDWSASGVRISVWVPAAVPVGLVERAVEAAWPGATTTTEDAPDGEDRASVLAGEMALAAPGWLPLRTDFEADPLRALLAAASVGDRRQGAAVHVLARPASQRAVVRCRRAARDLRLGRPASRGARLLDLVTPGPAATRPSADPAIAPEVRAIVAKSESPLWSVAVRYAVWDEGGNNGALRGRAHSLASAFAMYAGRNRLVRRRCRPGTVERRELRRGGLLSTPELAALAHLPTDRVVPSLARSGARRVAPPPKVVDDPRQGKVLGDSDAGAARPVVLRPAEGRFHLHVMGATGSGKSTLLTRLILDDVRRGRGAVVVDPKGDLVADVLGRLTDAQRERTFVLDPQAEGAPPTINMLERPEGGAGADLVVDHLVGIFSRIFEHHWGPRLEDVLRSACLTLLEGPGATLADVPRLLATPGAWQRYLAGRPDDELHGFWRWYESLGEGQRAQVVGPLAYKLRAFLLRPFVRDVVVAPRSSLDMAKVLDGGLLLARLPKGLLGEDTARLLGSFVVAKSWQAATARSALPEARRKDASLYVDECQNFLTLPRSFDEILAEARGYRLSLVLAHQHLGQLPRDLRDAVSANARNKVFFSMSPEDAFVLARQTGPQLGEHDLANLGGYQAAVRLVVDGEDQPAFTMRTRPLEAA